MLSVLFVDDDAARGGDGLSWASAYNDLQSALGHSAIVNSDHVSENDVDQIWIAEGVYKPSVELEPGDARSASFALVDGVTLYGGFKGWETSLVRRSWAAYPTILSGDIGIAGDSSDNAYTVVYCGFGVEASVNGVTITRGNATAGSSSALHPEREKGGGIFNAGSLNLTNTTIIANIAGDGGGIYSDSGVLNVTSCRIRSNWASNNGGGIHGSGVITVTNSDLVANSSHSTGKSGGGGGIRFSEGALTVTNCTFAENPGGGLYCDGKARSSTAQVNNTLFSRNGAVLFFGDPVPVILDPDIVAHAGVVSGFYNFFRYGGDQTVFEDGVDGNILLDVRYLERYWCEWDQISPFFEHPVVFPGTAGDDPDTAEIDESSADSYGDLRLRIMRCLEPLFPAVDGGDNSLIPIDHFDVDDDGDTTEVLPMDIDRKNRIRDDDANGTATVNIGAYESTRLAGFGGIPGDLNGDGRVDGKDLDLVRSNWARDVFPGDSLAGDANGDGYVDAADLDIVRADWGRFDEYWKAGASSSNTAKASAEQDSREAATDAAFCDIQALAEANWHAAINALKNDADEPSGPKRRNAIDLAWFERR